VRLDNAGDVLLAGRRSGARRRATRARCSPAHAAARPDAAAGDVDEIVTWRAPWIDPDPPPFALADVQDAVERVVGCSPTAH